MNRLLLSLLLVFNTLSLLAQCPPGSITLNSQADIDSFKVNYPNCSELLGNLTIQGSGITNLNGLDEISEVDGGLTIRSTSLANLAGLNQLSFVGEQIALRQNSSLSSIEGLDNIQSIGSKNSFPGTRDGLWIEDTQVTSLSTLSSLTSLSGLHLSNNEITSLTGLENITTLSGGIFLGEEKVVDFTGLDNLATIVNGLAIVNNNDIQSLNGLNNLSSVGGRFNISYNTLLTDLTGLESLTQVTDADGNGHLSISNLNLTSLTGLNTLETVDELSISYCDELNNLQGLNGLELIKSDLLIGNNQNLTSLSGLDVLATIQGRLRLFSNPSLINLQGLNGLSDVLGDLAIESNPVFENFMGLSQIQNIGTLYCSFNNSLSSLDGLESLNQITGSTIAFYNNQDLVDLSALMNTTMNATANSSSYSVTISGNSSLQTLEGLDNLYSGGGEYSLYFYNNPVLNDISAISNWTSDGLTSLTLLNNENLEICTIPQICNYMSLNLPQTNVSGNLGSCESNETLSIACNPEPECPMDDITLASQSEVDNFAANYAYCTKPQVSITIEGEDITSLEALQVITDIEGDLIVKNNPELISFFGLENLRKVTGNLVVENNDKITHLAGLRNIDGLLLSGLIIRNNPELSNCSFAATCNFIAANIDISIIENNKDECATELDVILNCNSLCPSQNIVLQTQEQVDNFKINYPNCTVPTNLNIETTSTSSRIRNLDSLNLVMATVEHFEIQKSYNETLLENLHGLEALRWVGTQFLISNNPSLTTLSGIDNLKYVGGDFRLGFSVLGDSGNESLTDITALNNLEYVGGDFVIEDQISLPNFDGLENLSAIGGDIIVANNYALVEMDGLNNLSMTHLQGGMEIFGNTILSRLANFESIIRLDDGIPETTENLQIRNNPQLIDLSVFSNLESISGSLFIDNNDSLVSLEGLDALTTIENGIWIINNSDLNTIRNLASVGQFSGRISIYNNDVLTSLDGLESIIEISGNDLQIYQNAMLNDIGAIANIDLTNATWVNINNNPNLALCNQPSLCQYLFYSENASIHSNNNDCNSIEEILNACDSVTNTITGMVRFDSDENGCDSSDGVVSNFIIETTDGVDTFKTFTNEEGVYSLLLREGDFTTKAIAPKNVFTVSPSSFLTTFSDSGSIETQDICVSTTVPENDVQVLVVPLSEPRPGFNVDYELVYSNVGSSAIQSGFISLEFDNQKFNFLQSSPAASNIVGELIEWSYEDLKPFETRKISVSFNLEAPPVANIQETTTFEAIIHPQNNDVNSSDNSFQLNQTLIGSYDPNDITVLEGEEVYIDDAGEYLNYVIRFQNTGTASAIDVKIVHELDSNLDWNTFTPLVSSHLNDIVIRNGSRVEYIFENINLPDSTSNEPASHGHVAFKIKPKSDLVVGDIISGVAGIYFDFNPPIITNTVTTEIKEQVITPPICTDLTSPLNGAINVPINSNLTWNESNGAEGYFISVGTDPGNKDILSDFDVGNVTTYDFPFDLPSNTEIFVLITPYSSSGASTGCAEESFTTGNGQGETLILTANVSEITCTGSNDGSIQVNTTGGTVPYIHELLDSTGTTVLVAQQASNLFENLTAGDYLVRVYDDSGDTVESLVTINEPSPITITTQVIYNSCPTSNDSMIDITATGGSGSYIYGLDNSDPSFAQTSNVFTNLSAGTYTVFVFDANGCVTSQTVVIEEITDCPSGSIQFSSDVTISEDAGIATFEVILNNEIPGGFTVDYEISGSTAQESNDFESTSGTLTFLGAAGEIQSIAVPIVDDEIIEATEDLSVLLNNLSNSNVLINGETAIGSIVDNDLIPGVSGLSFDTSDKVLSENSGTAAIKVVLTGNLQERFSIDYTTIDGTATNPDDYTLTSGSLDFQGFDGEEQLILIPIIDDNDVEDNEDFKISLSNLSTGLIPINTETTNITVLDNDEEVFTLPTNNFTIQNRSETCVNSNDGRISVTTEINMLYTGVLTLDGVIVESKNFTSRADFTNLEAGSYGLCITIDEYPEYEKCFSLSISAPEALEVDSELDASVNTVTLKMSGASSYVIVHNNKTYITSESEFILQLENEVNLISVKTDKECQGIYKETFQLKNQIKVYPNPITNQVLHIILGNASPQNSIVGLYTLSGRQVLLKYYNAEQAEVDIQLPDLPPATYLLTVSQGNQVSSEKIIVK